MPRKPRIEKVGFYHIINRGVAKNSIYIDNDDFFKFLEIMQEASDEYDFEIYSFCLMSNHYHLLIKTSKENLSIIMQKINSRYSIYFNNRYKRVGPLWQGRFKSWFVYDENYLQTLVRYIEFNPIKVNITKKIGEYKWAMSSNNFECLMLNYKLIDNTNFNKELDEKELKKIDELYHAKIEIKDDEIIKKDLKSIEGYFVHPRELAIFSATKDGYTQSEIAKYLNLSNVTISKILKMYMQKVALFTKLRDKGIFWSYSKDLKYSENLLIEYSLKYADFKDIILLLKLFGKRKIKAIWEKTMKSDERFIKLNLI